MSEKEYMLALVGLVVTELFNISVSNDDAKMLIQSKLHCNSTALGHRLANLQQSLHRPRLPRAHWDEKHYLSSNNWQSLKVTSFMNTNHFPVNPQSLPNWSVMFDAIGKCSELQGYIFAEVRLLLLC